MAGDPNTAAWSIASSSESVINIVLVGRTGNGKSASGNSILGKRVFESTFQAAGVTWKSEMSSVVLQDGPIINVIDTPGLFDLGVSAVGIDREIKKCFSMAPGEGIHAVLYVLSLRNRFTQEEESTFNSLQVLFGSKMIDHMIVLFTGGDELKRRGISLNDYYSKDSPEFLKAILRMCDGRKVMFDNVTEDESEKVKQVQELMAHIATIFKNNDGNPLTSEM